MAQRQIFCMMFLVVASASLIHGYLTPDFVDTLALPEFGQYSHNLASSSAEAASSAYNRFRTYFADGRYRYPSFYPRYGNFRRFVGVDPGYIRRTVEVQPTEVASSASASAASAANVGSRGNLGYRGGYYPGGILPTLATPSVVEELA